MPSGCYYKSITGLQFLKDSTVAEESGSSKVKMGVKGVHVPSIMILNIINRCNLHFKGCYHWALHESGKMDFRSAGWRNKRL